MHWPVGEGDCLDGLFKCKAHKDQKTRWNRRYESRGQQKKVGPNCSHFSHLESKRAIKREGRTLFVKKYCLRTIEEVSKKKNIRASEAVEQTVDEWEKVGKTR